MKTQRDAIRSWLKSGKTITPLEALQKWGCGRLAARVLELKDERLPIRREMVTVRTKNGQAKVARYYLEA